MARPSRKTGVVGRTTVPQKVLPSLRFLTFIAAVVNMTLVSIYWYLMSHLRYEVEDYPWSTVLSYAFVFLIGLGYTYSLFFPAIMKKESRLITLLILSVTVLVVKFRILFPAGFDDCDREITCTIEFAEIVTSLVLGFMVLPEIVLTFIIARQLPTGKALNFA
ncbi:hypothetical protein BGX33_007488 [Mortierella sp. NVP41]|nr:hypothetical protein BGX33_007488 [Mortierella sp. NVP41]